MAAVFWPAEALRLGSSGLGSSGLAAEAAGLPLAGDQPAGVDPKLTLVDASALTALQGDLAVALPGNASGDASVVKAALTLAASLALAPEELAGLASAANPLSAISEGAHVSGETDSLPTYLADLARQQAAQAGATMAASGLRFWQAAPLPAADGELLSDPPEDGDAALALATSAEADGLASLATITAPNALAPTLSPPGALVAKLAETALQSLFAAQAEAAFRDPGEGEGFGTGYMTMTGATGFGPATAAPATALQHLAGQLVQTLSQRPDGTTEIALSPDELGHVRVTLQADAQNPDRIIVMLNFERPETLDLFRRHADQLADALRDAGFSGADIGFGGSDGGENRNARPEMPLADAIAADAGPADPVGGPSLHPPLLRPAATSTLDLRL